VANEDKNAILTNSFRLELDGISVAAFSDCEISDSEYGVIEDRVGTDPNYMTVSQGIEKVQTITLGKNARDLDVIAINQLAQWYANGDNDKRGGAIDFLDRNGVVFHRVAFENAFCSKMTRPKFDATSEDKAKFVFVITAPRVTTVT